MNEYPTIIKIRVSTKSGPGVLAPLWPRFGPVLAESFCVSSLRVGTGYPSCYRGTVRINQGERAGNFEKIWVQKYDDPYQCQFIFV